MGDLALTLRERFEQEPILRLDREREATKLLDVLLALQLVADHDLL